MLCFENPGGKFPFTLSLSSVVTMEVSNCQAEYSQNFPRAIQESHIQSTHLPKTW